MHTRTCCAAPTSTPLKEKKNVFQNSQKQYLIMKIRQSHGTAGTCYMESFRNKSRPMLQREQKHEAGNKNDRGEPPGGRRSTLAVTAAADVSAEVTGGQLHFGVVTSHRLSPCSKRRTSVYTSPLFRNIYFANT